jgi:hypothetical protein
MITAIPFDLPEYFVGGGGQGAVVPVLHNRPSKTKLLQAKREIKEADWGYETQGDGFGLANFTL